MKSFSYSMDSDCYLQLMWAFCFKQAATAGRHCVEVIELQTLKAIQLEVVWNDSVETCFSTNK